jgi:hypothetical protein
MSNGFSLSKECSAVMFISTKCFAEGQEDQVKEIIDTELGDKKQFVGRCFGKFDIITEFTAASAEVASYNACNIQKEASEVLRQKECKNDYPICSSLVLCNELIESEGVARSSPKELSIRFYSLFVPKDLPINLSRVLREVKKNNRRILVSFSYFTFLLIISGDTFHKVFDDFMEFRKVTKNFFLESSTYVAVDWENKDKPGEKNIKANLLLKLKDGFGEIDDIRLDKFIKSKYKRFGSFDISLLVEEETLFEMKSKILKLRKNKKISHTSASILMEEENGTNGE